MEIEITQLLETDVFEFSHSAAEGGQNAWRDTWKKALQGPQLLKTPEEIQEARDYFRSTGGWDAEECESFSESEVQALLLQFISGDIREAGADSLDEIDWPEYEADESACHRLYKSAEGRIFYYVGN